MKKDNKSQSSGRKQFGNYIIGKTIGQGTFGKVKSGTHKPTNENVAIKILQKNKINDQADTERVLRQIHILKLVRHPNIVQLYEIIETPKKLFLVMEYMENGELFDYIVKNQRLDEKEACRLFHQLIDGIQYIHKIGIVHRDLKPENLLLDYKMNLRIVDFGLSNTYKKNDKLKTACGSPCYAAPEMLKGLAYDGLGVDIWSAGVILFAMVCGYLPFEDNKDQAELYRKIMQCEFKMRPQLSQPLKDLIQKILTADPQHRYTIDQIRKHPWMQKISQKKSIKGIIIGYNKIPIDTQILNSLQNIDSSLDLEKVQNCIEANRHNNQTTTYYLSFKKFIKNGGKSFCDMANPEFNKALLEPSGIGNRRDGAKNMVLMENFFTANNSTEGNLRKKSKQKLKQRVQKQNKQNKQNKEPNNEKQRQNCFVTQKSSNLQPKRSRKDSKISKLDPRIESSINYGRPSTTKSTQKPHESHLQTRLNRRYKQKFNQSLVSKSKQRMNNSTTHNSTHYQQQSLHQPHIRSRIDSSVTRGSHRNETYEITQIMQECRQRRNNSKKSCGQAIKSDMLKIAKARWM